MPSLSCSILFSSRELSFQAEIEMKNPHVTENAKAFGGGGGRKPQSAKGNSRAVKSPEASQGGRRPVGCCQGVCGGKGKGAVRGLTGSV